MLLLLEYTIFSVVESESYRNDLLDYVPASRRKLVSLTIVEKEEPVLEGVNGKNRLIAADGALLASDTKAISENIQPLARCRNLSPSMK